MYYRYSYADNGNNPLHSIFFAVLILSQLLPHFLWRFRIDISLRQIQDIFRLCLQYQFLRFSPCGNFYPGLSFLFFADILLPSAHKHSPSACYSILMFSPICYILFYHTMIYRIYKYQNFRYHFIEFRWDHLSDIQPGQSICQLVIPMDRHAALPGLFDNLICQNSFSAGYHPRRGRPIARTLSVHEGRSAPPPPRGGTRRERERAAEPPLPPPPHRPHRREPARPPTEGGAGGLPRPRPHRGRPTRALGVRPSHPPQRGGGCRPARTRRPARGGQDRGPDPRSGERT